MTPRQPTAPAAAPLRRTPGTGRAAWVAGTHVGTSSSADMTATNVLAGGWLATTIWLDAKNNAAATPKRTQSFPIATTLLVLPWTPVPAGSPMHAPQPAGTSRVSIHAS